MFNNKYKLLFLLNIMVTIMVLIKYHALIWHFPTLFPNYIHSGKFKEILLYLNWCLYKISHFFVGI